MALADYINVNSKKGTIMLVVTALVLIAISGMFFAFVYFMMDTVHTSLLASDCVIENNAFFGSCQDMWAMIVYPVLMLKEAFIWISFTFIFILVIGMLMLGYKSGTNPAMLGLLVVLEGLITYGSIYVANIYRLLLDNEVIRSALIPFSVYNKIMINFPWFVFIVSLFSLALGVINWQKSPVNESKAELDF